MSKPARIRDDLCQLPQSYLILKWQYLHLLPPRVVVRINRYTNKKLSKKSGKLVNAQ